MKCTANPACPFPPVKGKLCRQHHLDTRYYISLHDVSTMHRTYPFNDMKGFTIQNRTGGVQWHRRLRTGPHTEKQDKGKSTMGTLVTPPQEAPQRYHLPDTREGITHKFTIDGVRCYIIVGIYSDGRPGEIFLQVDKKGSFERGMTDAWAIMVSVALQHGIPLQLIVNKFKHQKFVPMGVTQTKNRELRFADSIVDYVVRWMEIKFIHKEKVEELPPVSPVQDDTIARCPHGYTVTDMKYPLVSGACGVCRGKLA